MLPGDNGQIIITYRINSSILVHGESSGKWTIRRENCIDQWVINHSKLQLNAIDRYQIHV